MDAIKALDEILEKKTKGMSKDNRNKAVQSLKMLYEESGNEKLLADYLLKLHYSVCQSFFEEVVGAMPDAATVTVAEALINNELFKKPNKQPHNIYKKCLVAVFALAQKGKFRAALLVLTQIPCSDGCKKSFMELATEPSNASAIDQLARQVNDRTLECSSNDRELLTKFLSFANGGLKVPEETAKSLPHEFDSRLNDICKTQQEMLSMLSRLTEDSSYITRLTSSIDSKEQELESARAELLNKEKQIDLLEEDVESRNKRIREAGEKISDLTERLRASFQMDERTNNQELIKLKNDISGALKLEYADFMNSRQKEYSVDMFEAYRAALTRIFKWLRKFDINCE